MIVVAVNDQRRQLDGFESSVMSIFEKALTLS